MNSWDSIFDRFSPGFDRPIPWTKFSRDYSGPNPIGIGAAGAEYYHRNAQLEEIFKR